MTKLSVIIPTHDGVRFLAECLASLQMQTLDEIEVLCIDDASTDATCALCELFAEDYRPLRLIRLPENRGVSHARNIGIREASGEYVAFIDDDDFYPEPDTLEKLYRAAHDNGAPIAGGSFSEFDDRTGCVTGDYRGRGHLSCFTFERAGSVAYRDWQGDFGFQRFVFSRRLLIENGIEFPPLRRHEDPVFLVRAMIAAGWFYAIPDVVYRYRFHHKPRMLAPAALDEAVEAIACILAMACQNDLDVLRGYQVELLKAYAADYLGLVFNERGLLEARAEVLRQLDGSVPLRRLVDGAAKAAHGLRNGTARG